MKLSSILCLSLIVCSSKAELELSSDDGGFTVSIGGIPIIKHSLDNPLLHVGNSEFSITENLGNFNVSEKITEKIGLPQFTIDSSGLPESIDIMLTNIDYPEASVRVTIIDTYLDNFAASAHIDIKIRESIYQRVWFGLESSEDEKIFGGGEQFTYLNLKGHEFPIWTREQGVSRNTSAPLYDIIEFGSPGSGGDYHTTYYPIAFFMSSRHYAIQSNAKGYSILNFTDGSRTEIYVHGSSFSMDVYTGSSLINLVSGITKTFSRTIEIPEWVYNGAIIAAQGGTEEMLRKLEQCRSAGVKVSALWIQDWAGKIQTTFGYRVFWNWKWNQELYPGLDTVIQDLASEGIRVTAYINPHLNQDGDIFQEAEQLGFLMKDSQNQTLRQDFGEMICGTLDLFNPQAQKWYSELIQTNILNLGFAGFMADFGEYTPLDANSLPDVFEQHNLLPVQWAATVYQALNESGKLSDVLPWARSGFSGAQRYHSVVWAGDQNVDWSKSDGLPSSIIAALSLGMSGYGVSHSDIGGYTTIDFLVTRSRELLLRWAEYSVFTPVMRTHEGNKPNLNHQIYTAPETLSAFARLTLMYSTLKPYHQKVIEEINTQGLPAMRPLFLRYENDAESYNQIYQYLYGEDLLVAPVLEPNQDTWIVYLPPDEWIHLWDLTETVVTGPVFVTVDSPLGNPPVYYRKSSGWIDLFRTVARI